MCYTAGDAPVLPGCGDGVDDILFLDDQEAGPVGCNVCISSGTSVFLNCSTIEGTEPILYQWTGPEPGGGVISESPLLPVSMEGQYNCSVTNLDDPVGVQFTTNLFCKFSL